MPEKGLKYRKKGTYVREGWRCLWSEFPQFAERSIENPQDPQGLWKYQPRSCRRIGSLNRPTASYKGSAYELCA